MRRKLDLEIQVGIFVFAGILLSMLSILMLGGGNFIFQRTYELYANFPEVSGLTSGGAIRSGGIKIGRVAGVEFANNYNEIRVKMVIQNEFKNRIKKDSTVRISTQGMLGDKYAEVSGGTPEAPVADEGDTLKPEVGKDLSSVLASSESVISLLKDTLVNVKSITADLNKNSEHLFIGLSGTAKNLNTLTAELNRGNGINNLNQTLLNLKVLTQKINNGEGTIGALLNDSTLYEDLKNLVGGATRNKVLKFFVRQAVKSNDNAVIEKNEQQEKADAEKIDKKPASN